MKAHTLSWLALIAICSLAVGAERNEETSPNELKELQGTWTVVFSEQHGEKRPDLEEVKKMRLKIEGDKWTLDFHNNVKDQYVATIKVDPATNPKSIDLAVTKGLASGETLHAIYELKGDNLKFCFPDESKQRPNNFNSTEGPGGRWLLVLKREK